MSVPAPRHGRWRFSDIWRAPGFAYFWGAGVFSGLGGTVTSLSLPLLAAIRLDATPIQMGFLTASETTPLLLFGLATGVWVDRRRKRPVIMATHIGRALLLLTAPIALWLGILRLEALMLIGFLIGALTVVFHITWASYLPAIVAPDLLTAGNARLQVGQGIAEMIAGWMARFVSAPMAIAFDSLFYGCAAVLVSRIRPGEPRPMDAPAGTQGRFWQELRESLRFVAGTPILRTTAAATGLWLLVDGARGALLVVFMVRTLGLSAAAVGLVFSCGAAGNLVGAFPLEKIAGRIGVGYAILLGLAATFPAELLMVMAGGPPVLATMMACASRFLSGVTFSIYEINQFSLRQAVTPLRLQGRINATMRTIIRGAIPLSALGSGLLAERIGLHATIVVSLLGIPATFLVIWFSPVRGLATVPARVAS